MVVYQPITPSLSITLLYESSGYGENRALLPIKPIWVDTFDEDGRIADCPLFTVKELDESVSSPVYRPLSILGRARKLLEKLIKPRLAIATSTARNLTLKLNQFLTLSWTE